MFTSFPDPARMADSADEIGNAVCRDRIFQKTIISPAVMGVLEIFRLIITRDPDDAQSAVGHFEFFRQSETSCSHGLDIDEYDIWRK